MLSRFDRLAYHSQHLSFLINATVMEEAARLVARSPRPAVDHSVWKCLQHRRAELHRRDLKNVEAGHYPRDLLFDFPVRRFLREFPRLLRDAPRVVRRMRANDFKDIPEVDKERFPPYYRRTFHWQTDFVDQSGGADKLRLLDLGCGTGRTLHQLAITHPEMRLHGADMSPAYIKTARKRLEHVQELSLAVENAESLPWADETFDIVTSTYMFHELPRNARRNVVREMLRVVRPGGLVVVEDSAQLSESPQLESVLHGFPQDFHEPFYADYLEDDLAELFDEAGFTVKSTEPHLVAKVVTATRP